MKRIRRKGKKLDPVQFVDIKKIRFAPELEVEFPKEINAEKIINHEKVRNWTVKYDGSLTNGAEFVPNDDNHLYYNQAGLRQIQDVLKRIKSHKGRISTRCGLHIHVDTKGISNEKLVEIVKEFIHKQRYIVKRFHVHDCRLKDACALIPRTYLSKLTTKKLASYRNDDCNWRLAAEVFDRHSVLNILCLPETGSIEFRLFNGSANYEQVKACIHWTLMFMKECLERD